MIIGYICSPTSKEPLLTASGPNIMFACPWASKEVTVLHVDDDELIRDLVKASLEFNGMFQVWSCDSGARALKIAPAIAPDLILLDMNMPGMTGLQTLKDLRLIKCFANTPVIFITSNLKRHEIQSYYDHSAIGFIPKPFDTNTLAQDILSLWNANKLINYAN